MQLAAGIAPDEVERLRWHAFGQKRALALKSAADLARFVAARGFVLVRPVSGLHYPSALEAAVGRPLLANLRDERGDPLEAWCTDGVQNGAFIRAAFVDRQDSLIARDWVAQVVTAGGWAAGLAAPAPDVDAGAVQAARVAIADRILRNVLVITSEELSQLVGWDEAAARTALGQLVDRGDALVHPSTRPRRAMFQAPRTELLPETGP
jgi:hypothetical protein